ncbi:Spy/CpxP family protein refolding chaperone [Planctomycetota bacterium]|nr:Spy/CpxP family protein refolding chaperone [Planctomycetota bacterium]
MNKGTQTMQYSKYAFAATIVLTSSFFISNTFANEARPRRERQKAQQCDGTNCEIAGAQCDAPKAKQGKQKKQRSGQQDAIKKHRASFEQALLKDIKLSAEQKSEIKDIQKEAAAERKEWGKDNHKQMQELTEDMRNAKRSEDKDEVAKLRKQMSELRKTAPKPDDTFKAIKEILTSKQQKQFDENLKGIREGWSKRRGEQANRGQRGPHGEGNRGENSERGNRNKRGNSFTDDSDRPRHMRGEKGEERGREEMQDKIKNRIHEAFLGNLDLTVDQEAEIKQILEDTRDQHMKWREENAEELGDIRKQMTEARRDDNQKKYNKLRAKMSGLLESAPKRESVIDEVKSVLTKKQKKQLDENIEKMKKRSSDMMKERRGRRGGPNERGHDDDMDRGPRDGHGNRGEMRHDDDEDADREAPRRRGKRGPRYDENLDF